MNNKLKAAIAAAGIGGGVTANYGYSIYTQDQAWDCYEVVSEDPDNSSVFETEWLCVAAGATVEDTGVLPDGKELLHPAEGPY